MTKKDYELIANAIQGMLIYKLLSIEDHKMVARCFAQVLSKNDQRFKYTEFMKLCGIDVRPTSNGRPVAVIVQD